MSEVIYEVLICKQNKALLYFPTINFRKIWSDRIPKHGFVYCIQFDKKSYRFEKDPHLIIPVNDSYLIDCGFHELSALLAISCIARAIYQF